MDENDNQVIRNGIKELDETSLRRRVKSKEYRFKLVIVGTYGVGKTSLMLQHFDRQFSSDPKTTVGVDFRQRKFHLSNASVILEVWDTAGEEKYANIVQIYYRGAHAVVAVYDIRKKSSYVRALDYISDITCQAVPPLVVALVGNKQDLSGDREVDFDNAHNNAADRNILFMETSAKNNSNVDQLFETVAQRLVEECLRRKVETESRKRLRLGSCHSDRTKKCCGI